MEIVVKLVCGDFGITLFITKNKIIKTKLDNNEIIPLINLRIYLWFNVICFFMIKGSLCVDNMPKNICVSSHDMRLKFGHYIDFNNIKFNSLKFIHPNSYQMTHSVIVYASKSEGIKWKLKI